MFFEKFKINLDKLLSSPILNNNPALPFKRISFGPVGQLEDIIKVFTTCASSKTFGNPSYDDVYSKMSDNLIKLNGLFIPPSSLTFLLRLFFSMKSINSFLLFPSPTIIKLKLI